MTSTAWLKQRARNEPASEQAIWLDLDTLPRNASRGHCSQGERRFPSEYASHLNDGEGKKGPIQPIGAAPFGRFRLRTSSSRFLTVMTGSCSSPANCVSCPTVARPHLGAETAPKLHKRGGRNFGPRSLLSPHRIGGCPPSNPKVWDHQNIAGGRSCYLPAWLVKGKTSL